MRIKLLKNFKITFRCRSSYIFKYTNINFSGKQLRNSVTLFSSFQRIGLGFLVSAEFEYSGVTLIRVNIFYKVWPHNVNTEEAFDSVTKPPLLHLVGDRHLIDGKFSNLHKGLYEEIIEIMESFVAVTPPTQTEGAGS